MKRDRRPIFRPRTFCCLFAAAFCAAVLFNQQSFARQRSVSPAPDGPQLDGVGERVNANTIAIISGNPNGTYLTIAYAADFGGTAHLVRPCPILAVAQ
jgi:hypothetical protein